MSTAQRVQNFRISERADNRSRTEMTEETRNIIQTFRNIAECLDHVRTALLPKRDNYDSRAQIGGPRPVRFRRIAVEEL